MPMFWGDYLRDTGHLSAAEHGAYLMLIAHQWTTAKPLPDDDAMLARIARMSPREWRAARRVLEDFFTVAAGYWSQKRVAIELERAAELYRQRQKGGVASGEKRRQHKESAVQSTKQSLNTLPKSVQAEHPTVRHVPEPEPNPEPKEEGGGDGSAGVPERRETPSLASHPLFHEVGKLVLQTMGVENDPRWAGNYSRVDGWLKAGFDPELDIIPTVRRLTAAKLDGPPKTLKYFHDAIGRAHAERTDPFEIPDNLRRTNGQRPSAPQFRNGFAQLIAETAGEAEDPGGLGEPTDMGNADRL